MLFLGFSSGLPLLLVLGTLSFWLREAGIERATIGFLSWVGLAYGLKWTWAPLVDRVPLPLLHRALGRRRSWLLLAQLGVAAGLVGIATTDPQLAFNRIVWFAVLTAFASATQDIALDAYRIEAAPAPKQAALSASYQTGYRLAMIWAGAGVLWMAARVASGVEGYVHRSWTVAYLAMAVSMAVGVVTVLLSPEPMVVALPPARSAAEWLQGTLFEPFADFFRRYQGQALLILALIAVYRISDVLMGIVANPFYVDMGFTKDEVALVSKFYGVIMTLTGAFIAGVLAIRIGVTRVLFIGALLSAATNLLFSWLAVHGRDLVALVLVISADNLSSGIASAAFVAYLSSLTSVRFSATQYALLSSIMLLLPKYLAGFSGLLVDRVGYASFFTGTALLGLPVLVLVWLTDRTIESRQFP
jgi:PAT family beta-lactamase induction signal transducer AmpG